MLPNGVVLNYDIAQPHMAAATIEMIWKLAFEHLSHPAYSSDLTPSDYHIFRPIIDALVGCWFENYEEVSDPVLCEQMKMFFTGGFWKLMDQSNKYVEKLGDYVEKLQCCSCLPFVQWRK
jgi:histone-lysine N-methyltransferase SETMAR